VGLIDVLGLELFGAHWGYESDGTSLSSGPKPVHSGPTAEQAALDKRLKEYAREIKGYKILQSFNYISMVDKLSSWAPGRMQVGDITEKNADGQLSEVSNGVVRMGISANTDIGTLLHELTHYYNYFENPTMSGPRGGSDSAGEGMAYGVEQLFQVTARNAMTLEKAIKNLKPGASRKLYERVQGPWQMMWGNGHLVNRNTINPEWAYGWFGGKKNRPLDEADIRNIHQNLSGKISCSKMADKAKSIAAEYGVCLKFNCRSSEFPIRQYGTDAYEIYRGIVPGHPSELHPVYQ
jgi:hypothetical protein